MEVTTINSKQEAVPVTVEDVNMDERETNMEPCNQAENVEDDSAVFCYWVDIEKLRQTDTYRDLFKRDPEVMARIRQNMQAHGFDPSYPIIAYQDVIVDGNCRYEIAKELGLSKVYVAEYGDAPGSVYAKEQAIFSQVARRNLTDADIITFVEKMDKFKKIGRPAKLASPDANKGKSAEVIASKLNTSPSKIEKARKILKSGDQTEIQQVKDGGKSLNQAAGKLKADQGGLGKPVYSKVLKALRKAMNFSGNDQEMKSDIEDLIKKNQGKLSA